MKKIIFLILVLLLCVNLPFAAMAEEKVTDGSDTVQEPILTIGSQLYVTDGADLLSDAEEAMLQSRLIQISEAYNAHISVVTVSAVVNQDVDGFIEQVYDGGGYGYGADKDGVMLLICMDPREYRILSNGFAADAISLSDIDSIGDFIVSDLTEGNYAAACNAFADECAYYLNGYINGFPFDFGATLVTCVIIGLIVGLIVALILKGQLRSVYKQSRANVYVKPGSMNLTQSGDYFMYRNVTRTPRQTSSSSSSSGSSRNVGGGSF